MALPQNFTPESKGRYVMSSLNSGETVKIRILSDFISGRIVWSGHTKEEKKPFRVPDQTPVPVEKIGTNLRTGQPEKINQFIAAICWNYNTERMEIFETDKATILQAIYDYEMDADYGDSKEYSLKIKKTGQGMDTKYSVLPLKEAVSKDILQAYKESKIDLTALYRGDDPFKSSNDSEDIAQDVADALDAKEVGEDPIPF